MPVPTIKERGMEFDQNVSKFLMTKKVRSFSRKSVKIGILRHAR